MPYWPFNATSKADDAAGQPQSWLSYLALPSLSSLPQIALPNARNLQRSVIRYLINRTLGAYFNIGHDGPDSQDIDADFANGQANLNKVSLRVDRVNELLKSHLESDGQGISVQVLCGTIDRIQVSFGNNDSTQDAADAPAPAGRSALERIFSAPISISAREIELDVIIHPPKPLKDKRKGSVQSNIPDEAREESAGLAGSTLNLAAAYVRDSEELAAVSTDESVLAQSEAFGLPGSFDAPGASKSDEDEAQIGLAANIIERLLARLQVNITSVRIRIHFAPPNYGAIGFERISLDKLLAIEVRLDRAASSCVIDEQAQSVSTIRTLQVVGLQAHLRLPSVQLGRGAASAAAGTALQPHVFEEKLSTPSPTSQGVSTDSEDDLAMSVAVLDLRASTEQLPTSRVLERDLDTIPDIDEDEPGNEMFFSMAPSRSVTLPTAVGVMAESHSVPIAGPTEVYSPRSATDDGEKYKAESSEHFEGVGGDKDNTDSFVPSRDISPVSSDYAFRQVFGVFTQGRNEMREPGTINVSFASSRPSTGNDALSAEVRTSSRIELDVPELAVVLQPDHITRVLSTLQSLSAPGDPTTHYPSDIGKNSQKRPPKIAATLHAKIAALKMFLPLQTCEATIQAFLRSEVTLPTSYLSLSLDGIEAASRPVDSNAKSTIKSYSLALRKPAHSRHRVMPILQPDPGLVWAYSVSQLRPGEKASHAGDWAQLPKKRTMEDWLTSLPMHASSVNSQASIPLLGDAVAVRTKDSQTTIVLQPVHVWLDTDTLSATAPWAQSITSGREQRETQVAHQPSLASPVQHSVDVGLSCLRLDVRCPSIHKSDDLRSGIVTIDVHDLHVKTAAWSDGGSPQSTDVLRMTVSDVHVFLCRAAQVNSLCVMQITSGNHSDFGIVIRRQDFGYTSESLPSLLCLDLKVPMARIYLDATVTEGLQYAVDDLSGQIKKLTTGDEVIAEVSRRLANASDESRRKSVSEEASSSNDSMPSKSADSISVKVSFALEEIHATIALAERGRLSSESDELRLRAEALRVTAEIRHDDSDEMSAEVSLRDAYLMHMQGDIERVLLQRLDFSTIELLSASIRSSNNASRSTKRSRLRISVAGALLALKTDLAWVSTLADILKAPPGAFADVEPADKMVVDFSLVDSRIRLTPIHLPSAIVIEVGRMAYDTVVKPEQTTIASSVTCSTVNFWVTDDVQSAREHDHKLRRSGYACLAEMDNLAVDIVVARPEHLASVQCSVMQGNFLVMICPDSLLVLTGLLSDLTHPSSFTAASSRQQAAITDSVILDCSQGAPETYVSVARPEGTLISEDDSETVIAYGKGSVPIDSDWFVRQKCGRPRRPQQDIFQLLINTCNVRLSLFEGYDFAQTRTTIRREVKKTRKRLERIRQLLASGQVPDDTAEEVAEELLKSVYLSPQSLSADEETIVDRIVKFDDELDKELNDPDDGELHSWESLPARPSIKQERLSSPPHEITRGKPALLRRKHQPVLTIILSDVTARARVLGPNHALSKRISVAVGMIEMIDNYKSSTWHKFMTELRPSDGGIVRPTDSPMVRISLKTLRGVSADSPEEAAFKAKISPLRLHIDQDILDFLKAFFAFKLVSVDYHSSADRAEQSKGSGFVQSFEILPIKIKLDYKPKRVDFRALRQGRAIELMNFFHFEASEMILRHVRLSGVADFARAGEMLQDIWTPDVKANQLADFLSGINPVRSVVNVGSGIADLVLLPIAQYQKDGRLIRGMQRGTKSFTKTTTLEFVKLGARLASGTQVILEHAERALGGRVPGVCMSMPESPGGRFTGDMTRSTVLAADEAQEGESRTDSQSEFGSTDDIANFSKFSSAPRNVTVGIGEAYRSLSGNMRSAAETILAVPMEVYESSADGSVKAVVRAVPIAVLKPMIGATEAISKTLMGLQSTLDPGVRDESKDKYKQSIPSSRR